VIVNMERLKQKGRQKASLLFIINFDFLVTNIKSSYRTKLFSRV